MRKIRRTRLTKKGDATQVFIYAISAVIVGLILYFGYRGIATIADQEKDISYIRLKADLEKEIQSMSSEYGSFRKINFQIPKKFTGVCFANVADIGKAEAQLPYEAILQKQPEAKAIIRESLKDKTQKNVFFIPDGTDTLFIPALQPEPAFFCVSVKAGRITLRVEGLGKATKVSVPP